MKRKGFTLVEMLIVVVIIGILASALIPRLTGAQARARDSARKANLNQLSTALSVYMSDKGAYPGTGGSTYQISQVRKDIVPTYIKSIPKDPQAQRKVEAIYASDDSAVKTTTGGVYAYAPLTQNAAAEAGMALLANTESEGKNSNWVVSASDIASEPDISDAINLTDDGGFYITNHSDSDSATDVAELSKTVCDTVSLDPDGTASLSSCLATTNAEMLYLVTQ